MTTLTMRPHPAAARELTTAAPPNAALRRVMLASYCGSAVEYYDFFVYGTAAALVFPKVFFSNLSPGLATVASLASFGTAFLARPIGAVVFGHIGDRLGRKTALTLTMMIMGIATIGVGLLPGEATIGIAAPLLLVALRLLQGFAVGGEWTGAALLCTESAPPHLRSRSTLSIQLGIGTALVVVNLLFLITHGVFDPNSSAFLQWGWRVPFLLSAVLIVIAIGVRRRIEEPAEYGDAPVRHTNRPPILEVMRRQPIHLLLAAGVVAGGVTLLYQVSTFLATYAETQLRYPKTLILSVGALGGLSLIAGVTVAGALRDRYSARTLIASGYAVAVPWSLAVLPLINRGGTAVFVATSTTTYLLVGFVTAPLAVFVPRIFDTRYRYSGSATAHNLGAILGGAIPPVISPLLISGGGIGVGLMMAGFSLLGLISVVVLGRTAAQSPPLQ